MSASLFYRIAAILLLLFTVAHTLGFSEVDPAWGINSTIASMQSVHFDALGSDRTYWDFFLASGYTVAALYLFAAIMAWQLGGLPVEALGRIRVARWAFALCFAGIAFVSWRYLFIVPVVFSVAITLCLAAGASLSVKSKT